MEALIELMVAEAMKTSEIEGAYLSRKDLMSSIKNNLGINPITETVKDQAAEGIGVLMTNVRNTYKEPLSEEVIFEWHKMLFKGQSGFQIGSCREHKKTYAGCLRCFGQAKSAL